MKPEQIEKAARHFCWLTGQDADAACKDAKYVPGKKKPRNWQMASIMITEHYLLHESIMHAMLADAPEVNGVPAEPSLEITDRN
jgi:hypothetical protein